MNNPTGAYVSWRKYGYAASVVTNRLKEIKERNKDPELVDFIAECHDVSLGQEDFINGCVLPETELQRKIAEDTKKDERAACVQGMLSGQTEGTFLKMIAEMVRAKSILEIGMYTGYSAINLASTAYCEELVTLDMEPYYESFLKERLVRSPLEKKIRIVIGPASESLVKLKDEGKQFDLIFIDADKTGYLNYYKFIMDNKMLKSTGVIVCDNILWDAKTFNQGDANGKALHEFVNFVKNDERVQQMILPIRDGIFVINQKITA